MRGRCENARDSRSGQRWLSGRITAETVSAGRRPGGRHHGGQMTSSVGLAGEYDSIVPRPPEAKTAAGMQIGISVTRESQRRCIFDEPVWLLSGREVMGPSGSTIRGVAEVRFIPEARNWAAGGCAGGGFAARRDRQRCWTKGKMESKSTLNSKARHQAH